MTAAAVRTRSPETTELGCRSLMRVFDDPQFATKIDQQLYSWCKQKNWDADLLTGPGVVDVAPGVTASLVRDQRQDGSTIERCRFHQDEGHGIWITEVTTLVDRDNSGWVWTDVYQPEGREARIPRLVGNILEVIDAFDGHHRITPTPIRADVDDVDEIYAAILDDDRRGFLFLAGSDDTMAIPQANWADYVKRLTGRTRGLANTYVLSPRATLALNTRLPESHRIREWSIRTFLPKPELDDPRDGVRHRVLSTGRIVNDTEYHLRDLLARAACRHSATTAIPRELVRIDRRLRELLDEAIVDGSAVRGPSTPVEAPHQTEESRVVAPTTTVPSTVTHRGSDTEPPSTSRLLAALRSVVTKVVGTADVTVEAIGRLGELAADSLMHEKNLRAVRERIHTIQSERNALEDRNIELAARAQDGQDELAGIRIELSATEAQLRHLRSELAKLDRGEVSWVPTAVSSDNPPDSFRDLIDRISEFERIVFTGDPKPAYALDDQNLVDWAIRTWDYLRALNDYCRLRSSGDFSGSVDDYVNDTPAGCATIPPGSHARGETKATQDHSEYGPLRVLPVPEAVDPSGKVFMGAHLRIAKFGSVSPRMHYFNDATGTGKIYVGYIGAHLPNFRTN